MKLSIALLLALVLLVALDAPSPADAQRRRRRRVRRGTCRRSCRGFGGRFRSCSYCRPIVDCRRACSSRPRNFNRCVRRCRNVNRQVRRGRCYRRRGFTCRRAVAVQPVDVVTPVQPVTPAVGSAFLIPGQFNAATNFCSEQCYSDARFISAAQCDRRFCFVRSSCGAFPQYPQAGRCTAGGANTPITLPDARVCFGNCLLESQFTGQFACDGRVCELRPCGTSLAARTFSCVAQQPVTVTPAPTMVAGMSPSPSPVVCPSACQSGVNAQVSFLTVQPTCPTTGCRIIRCTVQGATVTTLGHACVGPSVRGDAITSTPPSNVTNFPDGQAVGTPSPSPFGATGTTTVVTPSVSPTSSVTPSPSPTASVGPATVSASPSPTPSVTPSPTSTLTATPSPTPIPENLSASEWQRCTITRGGTVNRQNPTAANSGNPINVLATIRPEGVVNLGCRQNVSTVTCNTDGTISVATTAAQAAQLTLEQMFPVGAIFVYEAKTFGRPCVLTSFVATANQGQQQVAERQLRRRLQEIGDVYFEITRVSGTSASAVLTGTVVSPLKMFSSASISNVATIRQVVMDDEPAENLNTVMRQPGVATPTNGVTSFSDVITQGSLVATMTGDISNDINRLDAIDITVSGGGATVTSTYKLEFGYDVDFTLAFSNLGDNSARFVEEIPALFSNFTDFPEIDVTPDGLCCRLPTLKFYLFNEVYSYLVVAGGGSETISGSSVVYDLDYNRQVITMTANGPIDSPAVTVTRVPAAGVPEATQAPTAAVAYTASLNPVGAANLGQFNIDAEIGMIPSLLGYLPSVAFSMQQKNLFNIDDAVAAVPVVPASLPAACALNNLRIFTQAEAIDSQIVTLGGGTGQINGATQTIAISSMDIPLLAVQNTCRP